VPCQSAWIASRTLQSHRQVYHRRRQGAAPIAGVHHRASANYCARLLCALLILCPWFATGVTAGAVPTKVSIRSAGHERSYHFVIPTSLPATDPRPVLLLLHGSYSTPLDILPTWIEIAERDGVILVAPKSSADYGWRIHQDGPELMRDVIDDIAAKHPIDRRRLYLFGHSAGAVHALTLGLLESRYFAAVALHAGAWTDHSSFNVIPMAQRKIPMWIAVGDRDEQFPLVSVRATEAALQEAGVPVIVRIMKGHRHTYSDVAPHVNGEAWAFLQGIQLDGPPAFQPYR